MVNVVVEWLLLINVWGTSLGVQYPNSCALNADYTNTRLLIAQEYCVYIYSFIFIIIFISYFIYYTWKIYQSSSRAVPYKNAHCNSCFLFS